MPSLLLNWSSWPCWSCWLSLTIALLLPAKVHAETNSRYTITSQIGSLAPNAGGQVAYSLRLATNEWEASLFSNQYITAGGKPYSGGTYDLRFPICDDSCWWQFFVQFGGGVSNAGPLAEITWGTVIPLLPIWLPTAAPRYVPALRLDITSQIVFIRYRGVLWSYPLWLGVSIAI